MNTTHDKIINLLADALAHHFKPEEWANLLSLIATELDYILAESKDEIESFNRIGDMELQTRLFDEIRDLKLYAGIIISGIAIIITMIVFYA